MALPSPPAKGFWFCDNTQCDRFYVQRGNTEAESMKTLTILASVTGARLDSDVRRGGGSDDTRFLQQALDRAGED